MPKWITTAAYSVNYGWDYESKGGWVAEKTERFFTPEEELQKQIRELMAYLDANQYTIKAVIPKTQALGCHNTGQNWGWGYGVTPVTGFVVLAQHEREVSVEEYERLSRKQTVKNDLPTLREKCEKLRQAVDADGQRALDISEKKKLLGGIKYLVGEKEFDSRDAAEAALGAMRTECAARRAELEEARAEIGRLEDELAELNKQS